jgi:hypothetical protein
MCMSPIQVKCLLTQYTGQVHVLPFSSSAYLIKVKCMSPPPYSGQVPFSQVLCNVHVSHSGQVLTYTGQVHVPLFMLNAFPQRSSECPLPPLFMSSALLIKSKICLTYRSGGCQLGSSALPHRLSAKDLVGQICTLDSSLVHFYQFRVSYAKFGTFTAVSVNGTLVEAKLCTFTLESIRVLSSTSVPFTLATVQVPNLALTHTNGLQCTVVFRVEKKLGTVHLQ